MDGSGTRRVTVEEAAQFLGIKEESVRKRVSRGKLRADKDEAGRLLVYVDSTSTVRDKYEDQSVADRDELVVELRDRVRSLERRLDEEGESRRRADTIIAQLTQANTALSERLRELEAATDAPDAREGREDAAEGAAEAAPMVRAGQGDAGAPAASAKSSTRIVAEGVSVTVLSAAILATAVKVLFPLLVAAVALVVAGVAALNGQFYAALASGTLSLATALLSYLLGRRQAERERQRALDDLQRQMVEYAELQREQPPNGHSGGSG